MKTTKQALKKFYEEVGEKYPEEEEVYQSLRGILRRKFVLGHLTNFKGSLLDIGCNRAMYLDAYEGGARIGADLSYPVLKKAHQNRPKSLVVADAEMLTCFRQDCFNNILCSEVLEHCLNPEAVFKSILYCLKPGGFALLTTPNYTRKRPTWTGLGIMAHFGVTCDCEQGFLHTAYRVEQLERMARDSGLKIVESGTFEKEIKYAAKIPIVLFLSLKLLNRLFHSQRLDQINDKLFNRLCLWIYAFCHRTGLENLFLRLFHEGVRSYILMRK